MAVFNGEVYNYRELRTQLDVNQHIISSDCDTELIPHLYEEYQKESAQLHTIIKGMYSIAVWDGLKGQCTLLRDHIGKKPLFVLESDRLVAFASEQKAFGIPPDTQMLGHNIRVWELKPGETVRISNGQVYRHETIPSWRLPVEATITDMEEAASMLRASLSAAVQRRLPSNWQVAVLCSGGLDSVIIAHLAQALGGRAKAYVIGTNGADDVRFAGSACNALGIPLERVYIDEAAVASVVNEVVYYTESFEPNIVRNSLLAYLLSKRIRQDDYRVAFCGEGADELLFGYGDFERAKDKHDLMVRLLDDLHRTQLLRVDRTSMAFNLEIRAPFLDCDFLKLACRIAADLKWTRIYGTWQGKAVLRQAFKEVLPWEIVTRTKATFSYGAGFGDVSMDATGPLERYAAQVVGEDKSRLERKYPHLDVSTFERALYLYFFEQFYSVPHDYRSPHVAKTEVTV